MRDAGLIGAAAGENVVRLLPPLNVGEAEIDEAVQSPRSALVALEPVPAGAAG